MEFLSPLDDAFVRAIAGIAQIYGENEPMTYLSPHFTLKEMTRSQTAARAGILNIPSAEQIAALTLLCVKVLEPVRAHFGPVHISSGFRGLLLNKRIGGSQSSQHPRGEAADFEVPGVSNFDVALWIANNLEFDQLILEMWRRGDPNAGWIHVSYRKSQRRNQCLTFDGKSYKPGLLAA